MKKMESAVSRLAVKGIEMAIAAHLFPDAPITDWGSTPSPAILNIFDAFNPETDELVFTRTITEFTVDELKKACMRLTAGKAGAPRGSPTKSLDGPSLRIRRASQRPTIRSFPACWKRAKLVLLHKGPGKPMDAPSSYRPICLLDTPGKLLERLLIQRLEGHLESRMAPNQFGFRKGVSTESAVDSVLKIAAWAAATNGPTKDLCVLVTLDVMNAFNTLRWPVIDEALRRKGTPEYLVQMLRSWLSDRDLLFGDAGASKPVTCGVPQ